MLGRKVNLIYWNKVHELLVELEGTVWEDVEVILNFLKTHWTYVGLSEYIPPLAPYLS